MTSLPNKPIRVALIGSDIGYIALHRIILTRNQIEVVGELVYEPSNFTDSLADLCKLTPDIYLIGRFSHLEFAESIASQIKATDQQAKVIGSVAAPSKVTPEFVDCCLFMPTTPKDVLSCIEQVMR